VPPAAADSAPEPGEGAAATAAKAEEDIHVEAQIDQAVFDQLIAEGKPERIARAKAKAAYVRAAKARIRAEREQASA
jgi:NADH-quinone oxidoreductase subunit I